MADTLALQAWSIDNHGRYYPGCPLLRATTVLLDGVPMERVREWNCATGMVRRIAIDESGSIKINHSRTEIVEEVLFGTVTVTVDEGVGQSL